MLISRRQQLTTSTARRTSRRANATQALATAQGGAKKKVLILGGTRFIGVYLSRLLVADGHDVSLFTRGKSEVTFPIPDDTEDGYKNFSDKISHIKGDRTEQSDVDKIKNQGFNVVYDLNGREQGDTELIVNALPDVEQYIYCSSAGVYKRSDEMPHVEGDEIDPKSRHKGKHDSETLLQERKIPFTSIRPVYIYGPLNYNPVEEWFFDRIAHDRPVPVPNSGEQLTSLGHVKDLAEAFRKCMGNARAVNQIYNVSGERYVTFNGVARACAKAMGKEARIVNYDPSNKDTGKKKAFPLRDQHFFASVEKAKRDLDWEPAFSLEEGVEDSYLNDFQHFHKQHNHVDFSLDDIVLA